MIDYSVLETLAVIAFSALILDAGLGLFMKMRLLHKCRVICGEESDSD